MCVINAKINYIKQCISYTFLIVFFEKVGSGRTKRDYTFELIDQELKKPY